MNDFSNTQPAPADNPDGTTLTAAEVESFIDGYVECALWADCMPADEDGEIGGGESLGLRPEAREKMSGDCRAFCAANADLLNAYAEQREYDPSQGSVFSYAGHDFWLTRSGHGTGFWDRGLGELGEKLTAAAKAYGSPDDHTPFDCGDGTADA